VPILNSNQRGSEALARVAVFLRAADGAFQITTVRDIANRGRAVSIYQLIDCAVHCMGTSSNEAVSLDADSALFALSQIPAEVLVFINRPLESLNHAFFEELAAKALREECGLVTGISVDVDGHVLHSGFARSDFFAIRREHLIAVGGLSSVSAAQMPRLVRKLVMNAKLRGLRVIVTPFAIASFHHNFPDVSMDLSSDPLAFDDLVQAARGSV
jgi:hypothetical protein